MDFVEQILGFAPDGGSGLFELLLATVTFVGFVVLAWKRSRLSQLSRHKPPVRGTVKIGAAQ